MAVMEFCSAVSGDTTVGPRELKTREVQIRAFRAGKKFKIAFIYPGSLAERRTLPCQMLQNSMVRKRVLSWQRAPLKQARQGSLQGPLLRPLGLPPYQRPLSAI